MRSWIQWASHHSCSARGFAPGPLARSLARRFDGSLRARGSLAALVRGELGARGFLEFADDAVLDPVGIPPFMFSPGLRPRTPCTLSRAPLRRLAPCAWLTRCARSRRARCPRLP